MTKRYHLIIDSNHCDSRFLNNCELLKEACYKLAKLCDMHILYGPVAITAPPENPGISCFSIIDFSHISIHTFTETREVCIDIFSCKKFDYALVKAFIIDFFNLELQYTKEVIVKYDRPAK